MHKHIRFPVYIAFVFVLAAAACRGAGEQPGPFREFTFTVDSLLLGDRITVREFSIQAPAGWISPDSGIIAAVRTAIERDTSRPGELEAVRINLQSGGVLVISKLPETANGGFVPWARQRIERLRTAAAGRTIEEEWLLLNGIRAVQLYLADSSRVQFKFLLDSSPPTGLDFSVPSAAWEREVRSVESAIGSIRRNR